MAEAVKNLRDRFPAQGMRPGDIYMTNDPWLASGHLNDFLLMQPVFFKGRVVGFTSCTSHLADLGGKGMGPEGSDVFDEGLMIPPCKLVDGGALNALLMDIVRVNSREPIANEGDIYALIACCETGAKRLADMMQEFGIDDLDPLSAEPNISVEIIAPGQPLPGDAQMVLIPGSKSTIADLEFFRAQGWDIDLTAHIRRGGHVLGICGGYQMLGRKIHDPNGLEGTPVSVDGLGHLDVETTMQPRKQLSLTSATYLPTGDALEGYEIHLGNTSGPDCGNAWLSIQGLPAGAARGRVRGCYLHGLFSSDGFRQTIFAEMGAETGINYEDMVETTLDALAQHMEQHLKIDQLITLASEPDYSSS